MILNSNNENKEDLLKQLEETKNFALLQINEYKDLSGKIKDLLKFLQDNQW